jgi:CubicO group peptidase (beta-lactamase class C family)
VTLHRFGRAIVGIVLALAGAVTMAAPDEVGYGRDDRYPIGDRTSFMQQRHMVGAFSNMSQLFPVRSIKAGTVPRELPRWEGTPDLRFIDAYLDNHPATGLVVLKDGKLLYERYQYGRRDDQLMTSWSMAKTLVGMAVGIAVAEGRIASIDDPLDRYEPALASSAWKGISIRHALNMSSGVAFDETYNVPGNDIAVFSRPWSRHEGSYQDIIQTFRRTEAVPGERFKYISSDTQALALAFVKAVGRPLSDYVGEKIWAPMGAEADAEWLVDPRGMEAAYCCFNARLRDWARLGQLLLEGGARDGKALIPADWVDAGTTVRLRDQHLQPRRATPYFGYGYQTWVFPDHLGFALQGVRGQAVFVHPRLKLVMAQTAVWTPERNAELGRQRDQFWRELVLRASRF